ncbi:MAG: tetrahydromethanopterin S-methyltransferase subunit A [Candidatus Altiarchaeota archaeon]
MEWPVEPGEFVVVNPCNHIAVVTLDDDLSLPTDALALYGKSRTENLGVERVVVNTVSNPSIRVVVVCGEEIHGHLAGQAIVALWENGIDDKRRIIGAKGAIPYIQNLPYHFIERFRQQVEVVNLIGVVDEERLADEIGRLAGKKYAAFAGEDLDFDKYLLKPESAVSSSLNLGDCEVSLSPEYGVKYDTATGQVSSD